MSNKLKPKIKMTKALPSEEGEYYFNDGRDWRTRIIEVVRCPDSGALMSCLGLREPVADIGGYWAKVDQDHFEFED